MQMGEIQKGQSRDADEVRICGDSRVRPRRYPNRVARYEAELVTLSHDKAALCLRPVVKGAATKNHEETKSVFNLTPRK
jgi:hypothetical protein